jgi:hypothetical protein
MIKEVVTTAANSLGIWCMVNQVSCSDNLWSYSRLATFPKQEVFHRVLGCSMCWFDCLYDFTCSVAVLSFLRVYKIGNKFHSGSTIGVRGDRTSPRFALCPFWGMTVYHYCYTESTDVVGVQEDAGKYEHTKNVPCCVCLLYYCTGSRPSPYISIPASE